MDVQLILIHGAIGSLALTVALLLIGLKNPRLMLQDYPSAIRNSVPPKTKVEKKQMYQWAWPFLVLFIGYPIAIGIHYTRQFNWPFIDTFALVWGMQLVFNVYDLLILDWLIFCTITPKLVIIPGTENNPGYKDYKFHFIGF